MDEVTNVRTVINASVLSASKQEIEAASSSLLHYCQQVFEVLKC